MYDDLDELPRDCEVPYEYFSEEEVINPLPFSEDPWSRNLGEDYIPDSSDICD